ncbi:uncharacterized protein C22orf15 isoform X1 [Gouania willdenowi]|uniref:uncharacterized protein C22orf15 isoform X1 n=1 Tax=Gouania willdenowi TaxID=441366 RepID=UPI00105460CC|nr:uncharacterized protein C22orf15 homolog isoform X1 [Gouania willdenowi]
MFVTILFGEGRMELLNLNCRLINFIHHLKEKSGLDSKERVGVMDSSGKVINLQALPNCLALASSVLVERQFYVLLRACRDEDTGAQKYVSLLTNYSQSPAKLTELLKNLSKPQNPDRRTKKGGRRRNKKCL